MQRIHLDQDVHPLSDLGARAEVLVDQLRETKRPIVLTQDGRSAAVLVDTAAYEQLLERVALLQDIHAAEQQLAETGGVPHDEAKARVLERLNS